MGKADRSFLVGLIGSDLGPSLSPSLHEREADRLGVRYLYQSIDLDVLGLGAHDVGALVEQAGRLGFAGLNITHPAKQTVVDDLADLSPEAATVGAVNTIVFRDGRAVGHNTDWSGFAWGLRRSLPDVPMRHVVLLGAGGAGAAVAYALARLGVRRLTIVDPVVERADRAAIAAGHPSTGAVPPPAVDVAGSIDDAGDELRRADGLVNATPVGMVDGASPLPVGRLRPDLWVLDIIYRPLETELLRQARGAGCATVNGGGMVVAQAAEAFRLITGIVPDVERMYRHFEALTEAGGRPVREGEPR
jgi:shikimate dehydrogenase